jgi:hypothetical protein
MTTLQTLIPLPKKYIKDPVRIKEYEALEKDPAALLAKFKWWSLHDLMLEYHDGLVPKENNANFLKFAIDLSSEELNRAKITDPNRLNQIQTLMTPGLKSIETATDQMIMQKQIDASQQLQSTTMNALARIPGQPMPAPGMPTSAPGMMAPGMAAPSADEVLIEDKTKPYAAVNLEKECFKDLLTIALTSKARIFVTDGVLPMAIPEAPAIPDPTVVLTNGGRFKSRKLKKYQKKRKTRRNKRQPLKKVGPKTRNL